MSVKLLFLFSVLPSANPWIVNTSYGFLKGMPIRSVDGQPCHIFKGIPLAKPPIGERRFKLPEPPERWEGVRDATHYSAACLSNSTVSRSPQKFMSEDCLYMNIFVSENCLQKKHACPVVFYLHGGSLNYDSAVMFDDQYITDRYSSKDVIFVISAFRLGIFGVSAFADDTVVPRNLALYDIVAGLEIMHEEIEAFGGDPMRVTLMGHSQGASIAVVFAVSSLIDPDHRLFQQVLALSPTINYRVTSNRIDLTWQLAYELGCTPSRLHSNRTVSSEDAHVVACLRKLDALELLAKQRLIEERDGKVFDGILYGAPFVGEDQPVVDFVRNCPARPMISSSTRYEYNNLTNEETDDIGSFLQVSHPEQVRKKYFYDMSFKDHRDAYLSQVVFANTVMFGTAFTEKGAKVYLMEFDHGPLPLHSSDMPFFIGLHMRNFTADEHLIDQFYAKSFINFIYGRKPRKDWLPFDPRKRNYYSVEANLNRRIFPRNKMGYHSEVVDYWLQNMTQFDKSLSEMANTQLRYNQVDVTPGPSIFRSVLSALLFGLGITLGFLILMAVWAALSPQDPPNHEKVPLVHRKETQINRKNTMIVSSLKTG